MTNKNNHIFIICEKKFSNTNDLIHELHTSENKIKEEIEKIYTENKTIKNQIIDELIVF